MNKTIHLSIIIGLLLVAVISFVSGQTTPTYTVTFTAVDDQNNPIPTSTPQPTITPTPAQLEGYLEIDFSITNEFVRPLLTGNRISFRYPDFIIFQNNAIAGYFSVTFYANSLSDGVTIFKIKSGDVEVGEARVDYTSASKNVNIKSVQATKASIAASRISLTNEHLGMSNNFDLVLNNQIVGYTRVSTSLNTLSDFDDDKIFSAELKDSDSTGAATVKVGDIKIDASHIELKTIQRVQNTFSGKVTSLAGEPITLGNVCVVAGESPERCLMIRKASDGSGNYAITIYGKDKTKVIFKVKGVEVGTKELDPATPQVTFDLQIDTSNVNFADNDRDGIPNGIDKCSDSVVPDVDVNGCDCSQKQCGVGAKCETDFYQGNNCVSAPIKRCSQKSACSQKKGTTENDAPKYCNPAGIVINNCKQCGCPTDFTCSQSGDCIKVLTGLVGSVCKDNDLQYSLSRMNCPEGWIREDLTRYLSIDVDGPPLIEDIAQDKVDEMIEDITLCLKTSDLGCAPRDKPYKCLFEELLDKHRGEAATVLENMIAYNAPVPTLGEVGQEAGEEIKVGFVGRSLADVIEFFFGGIDLEPHVDLTNFNLRKMYDCPPKLITSDVECTPLINNGPSDKRADIVFVGDGFLDDASFINTLREMLDYDGQYANTDNEGFFSIEPFKSAKTRFNIWAVNGKNNIAYYPEGTSFNRANMPRDKDVNDFASYCPNKDYVVALSTRPYRSFCFFEEARAEGRICFVSLGNRKYLGRLLLHELGHGFASLEDEYANEMSELKDAPNRIEELVTGIRTTAANCKATQEEAQTAWGSLITPENKLGFFKGCGGDCMPYCKDAVRPTYLSVMNTHFLNVESQIATRDAEGILQGFKGGALFHPYYLVNEIEIKKELDKYEAGDPKDTKFYESTEIIEEEEPTTPEQPQTTVPTPTPTAPPTTPIQPTSGTLRNQVIKNCALNTLCDVPQTPVEYIYVNADNVNEVQGLGVDGKVSFAVNTQYGSGVNFNIPNQNVKLAIVQKDFSAVLFAECQTALASSTLAWTHELTDNKATVCLKGDEGTMMKLGNTKIEKSTKSTKQTTLANCGQQGQPACDVLNQIMFDYSIDYATLTEQTTQPQSPTNPTCIDSDNGKNYYFKGLAERTADNVLGPLKVEDSCVNSDLQEVTCPDPYGNTLSSTFTCQNGCSDGACIPLPAETSMSLSTDKSSYALNEKVTVISQLPSSMDAMYYFVSSAERRWVGSGGSCPAAGSCFGYDRLLAGNWQAEIIAWQHNTPETAYKINSAQFTVQ